MGDSSQQGPRELTPDEAQQAAAQAAMLASVQPGPVPLSWEVEAISTPDVGGIVVLTIQVKTHRAWYFLDPRSATGMAADLESNAGKSRSGLVVPDVIPPDLRR